MSVEFSGHDGSMSSAPQDATTAATVKNNEAGHRYEVVVDGVTAGLLTYLLHDDKVVFNHAEVYPRFEGQGVGSALARSALDDVIAQGKTITPLCPFIVNYLAHHPSYLSHVDEVHRQEIEALIATAPDDDEVA
jgi:predicted GNAT family acetyltransferase